MDRSTDFPTRTASLRRRWRHTFPGWLACALLLGGPPHVTAAEAREAGAELHLAADFGTARFQQMPRRSETGWQIRRHDYPAWGAAEWQIGYAAGPDRDSPVLNGPRVADFAVHWPSHAETTLHWSRGSHAEATDFEPRRESLRPGVPVELASYGGRSSDGVLPYFNLATTGGGLLVAVGWTGDWQAKFDFLPDGRVHVTIALPQARFRLWPGEAVRLPSLLVMPYRGDWIDGQNRFRRLMRAEFTPRNHPAQTLMPVAASVHGLIGFNDTTASNLVELAGVLRSAGLPLDTYWLDAGWSTGGFPHGQGNPMPDPVRFPAGLAPVGRAAREAGLRFLAWFEPERVMPGTWVAREHADWLLSPTGTPPELRYQEKDGFRLLDLGHPDARRWATEEVSRQLAEADIAIYRQDFNLYPAWFWHTGEAPDRRGLREIRHVTGLYEFLDELVRRRPGLIIDNCASGGRRLDFEMMRRSVALWRSDSCWGTPEFPRSVQAMAHGLSLWLPLQGLGAAATDELALRSGMGACASFAINYRDAGQVEALRRHLDRYLRVRSLFLEDYHPLTTWSADPRRRLAWQFHDPATGRGLVQVFPGRDPSERAGRLSLRAVDPAAAYQVIDWDRPGASRVASGRELRDPGLVWDAPAGQEALVFEYQPAESHGPAR